MNGGHQFGAQFAHGEKESAHNREIDTDEGNAIAQTQQQRTSRSGARNGSIVHVHFLNRHLA